jgi:hypothetical protein
MDTRAVIPSSTVRGTVPDIDRNVLPMGVTKESEFYQLHSDRETGAQPRQHG